MLLNFYNALWNQPIKKCIFKLATPCEAFTLCCRALARHCEISQHVATIC